MEQLTITANKFQDRHGNTCHVARVNIDGDILTSGITYGDQFMQTGVDMLVESGILSEGFNDPVYRWCRDRGVKFGWSGQYTLKRDLFTFD